ncbi:MAG: hypothetical protein DCC55_11380 [Chloroflexi bacterium]|nr:MAG: hypothetical protein DCC55_11380 [Chloroflexota bacterium]
MAIRFDASADRISRNSDLPASSRGFTWVCWYKTVVDRNDWSQGIGNLSASTSNYIYIETDATGTQYQVWFSGGSNHHSLNLLNVTVNQWVYFAYTTSSSGSVNGYHGALGASLTKVGPHATAINSFAPILLQCGDTVWTNEWCNGVMAYAAAWNAELTQAELELQRYSIMPVRTADLYGWWPMMSGVSERLADYSGNSRNWTAGGTLTDEDGPPISYRPYVWAIARAVGGGDETKTVEDTGAGADALSQVLVSLALSDSGNGVDSPGAGADVSLAESGTGIDALAQILAVLNLTDIGAGADVLSGLAVEATIADGGTGVDAPGVTVILSVVDSGDGAEAVAAAILATIADSGVGADAITGLSVNFTMLDAGAGAESLSISVSVAMTDAGSLADAVSLLSESIKSILDSGTFTDVVLSPVVSLTVGDAGSALDTPVIAVTLSLADSATGADVLAQVLAACSLADAGTGADTVSDFGVLATVADSGTGVDASSLTVSLSVSDMGVGIEAITGAILAAVAESGAGTDAVSGLSVTLGLADAGAGAESLVISASVAVTDAGSLADAVALLAEDLKAILDSGSFVDVVLSPVVSLAVEDAGSAVDTTAITVTLSLADGATGAELISIIAESLKTVLDLGSGSESVNVLLTPFIVADSGDGSDTAVANVTLTLSDAVVGNDAVVAAVLATVADVAAGSDAVGSITVNLAVTDTGQGATVLGQVAALIVVLEQATGIDVAVGYDSAVRIVRVSFSLASYSMVCSLATYRMEFELNSEG